AKRDESTVCALRSVAGNHHDIHFSSDRDRRRLRDVNVQIVEDLNLHAKAPSSVVGVSAFRATALSPRVRNLTARFVAPMARRRLSPSHDTDSSFAKGLSSEARCNTC